MRNTPLIVELVGPAGVGKTSILRVLKGWDRKIQAGVRIPRHHVVLNVLPCVPEFLALRHHCEGRTSWRDFVRLWRLTALESFLHEMPSTYDAVVLEEGPVYMLTRLRGVRMPRQASRSFDGWWQRAVARCARAVHTIVFLDAPDSILVERIRSRSKAHRMKHVEVPAIRRFLCEYRAAYEYTVSEIAGVHGAKIVRFLTDSEKPEEIAARMLDTLKEPA